MAEVEFENDSAVGTHSGTAAIEAPTKSHEDFPFEQCDSLKDTIRERLAGGEKFEAIIHSLAVEEAELLVADRLAVFVAIIRAEKKPILFLDCLWMLSGAALREGETIQTIAKKHGTTKQAIQQAMERVGAKFTFPKTRTQRSDEAKEHMRAAYNPII